MGLQLLSLLRKLPPNEKNDPRGHPTAAGSLPRAPATVQARRRPVGCGFGSCSVRCTATRPMEKYMRRPHRLRSAVVDTAHVSRIQRRRYDELPYLSRIQRLYPVPTSVSGSGSSTLGGGLARGPSTICKTHCDKRTSLPTGGSQPTSRSPSSPATPHRPGACRVKVPLHKETRRAHDSKAHRGGWLTQRSHCAQRPRERGAAATIVAPRPRAGRGPPRRRRGAGRGGPPGGGSRGAAFFRAGATTVLLC